MARKKNYRIGLWLIASLLVIVAVSVYMYYFSSFHIWEALLNTIQSGENTTAVEVYFTDNEKTTLKSEKLIIKTGTKDVMTQKVMETLLQGPKTADCKRIIPESTKLLDSNVMEGEETTVTVNLSSDFYLSDPPDRVLGAFSIVKTLCSLEGVDNVNILVDASPVKNATGEEMGVLDLNDVMFDNPVTNKSTVMVNLYFMNNDLSLSAEQREIEIPDNEQIEKVLVDELIKGPTDSRLSPTIQSGTKIKSIETTNGVCFVNLTGTIATASVGTLGEELQIYSIVNTLTEVATIDKVQILIDGQKTMHHLDVSEPLARDESLID